MIMKLIHIENLQINLLTQNDGNKAVEIFRKKNKNKNIENIDIIIIDLNMK